MGRGPPRYSQTIFFATTKPNQEYYQERIAEALANVFSAQGRIHLYKGNLQESISCYNNALSYATNLENFDLIAKLHNNLGVIHRRQSSFANSLYFFQKAFDYFEQKNDTAAMVEVLVNIGSVSFDIGAYEKSFENFLKAIAIFEQLDDQESLVSTLISIGGVMVASKNSRESIKYYHRALSISNDLKDERGVAGCLLSLGISHLDLMQYDSAYTYLSKSRNIYRQLGDKIGETETYQNIGGLYVLQQKYTLAKNTFLHAKSLAQAIGLNSAIANITYNLALISYRQDSLSQALDKAFLALNYATRFDLISLKIDVHKTISEIYNKIVDYQNSLNLFKLFFSFYDSIYSSDRAHKFAEMETLYQLEQKQIAIKKLEKEKELKEIQLQNAELILLWQRTHSIITLGVLLLMLLIMFMLYRQFRIKRRSNSLLKEQNAEILQKNVEITTQKEEIELQKNELESQKEQLREKSEQLERFNWLITDSIDYASSIQSALLPPSDVFSNYFDDHFLIFFPKDVVSGDFYWTYTFDDAIIIALADCTGHGVPGGFMSMLSLSVKSQPHKWHIWFFPTHKLTLKKPKEPFLANAL